ncbi:NADH dehydrogenase [ubiquinone] 1 alpha subcomplex subunit 8 [Biomphalaria glabrata]|uniref:NADH dehydrogenase [ubiquinone] 1 alpha subcomplex subunit 8 n=1 Tax=Biomphalaria glabrata TaxID=6526 RepID=A0A9W2YD06_BIOGL|nr:NADH dehydrogenase [ubiquinone] 1 alpha subcomplex subunit 8-like [Biomphalaria glabrata]KAI8743996.1 dehydrogenase [ubiquinone] 1 alpha subcomplex subunit 8 [Biomphalaria glabrata]
MPYTNEDYLPSYEELTVPELEISSAAFRTAAHHLGKYCDNTCKEFILCRTEENDPRKCLNEGKEVTRCAYEFLGKIKKSCYAEFTQYMDCIDHSGLSMEFKNCRKTQAVFDACVKENLGQDRPELGYFTKVRLHKTERPKAVPDPHILPERLPEPPKFENKTTDPMKGPRWF